ncbi:MAG: Gfo/Idh/MocA family oxidoreductase [Victivallaceae bacterium]|jgi:predicted dehydrogenase
MSLRAGIIGCGGIANAHVDGYKSNNIQVTAVTDICHEAAVKMAEITGAKIFKDADSLIKSGMVDMVSICTPPVAHEEPALLALEHGVHVLMEKPQAHILEAAQNVAAAAAKSKALFMIAFRHRFLPAIVKMKEIIQSGEIGNVVFFQNIFCGPAFYMKDKWFSKKAISGGGCMLDTSSHSVDLFRFLIGEASEQHGLMNKNFAGTDVEDASIITLKAENGAIGSLIATWVAGVGTAEIIVMGDKGMVKYDYTKPENLSVRKTADKEFTLEPVKPSNGFAEEIAHFVSAIEGKTPVACTAHDGVRCIEIINSVYQENKA